MKKKTPKTRPATLAGYDDLFADVVDAIDQSRRAAARSTNAIITATYWFVGRRIVETEQAGDSRAEYGKILVTRLSRDLKDRFGRGFGRSNLFQIRAFYLAYRHVLTDQAKPLAGEQKVQTASGLSATGLDKVAAHFPLPWSHYVRLLSVQNASARAFYEAEALRGGWTVRQLDRQVQSQFYERTALSQDKAAMLEQGQQKQPRDAVTADDVVKDPYVLEFLGLKDEFAESDLEAALVGQLEDFLLELGGDFTFAGRQRRLRIGNEWYRIDLLFFNRRLRCLVIIDLKLGKFSHADAGQMHLYLNYAREHWMLPGENPPVGLILCAEKDQAVAKYALDGLPNKVMAAEYRTALPNEQQLVEEIEKARRQLEARGRTIKE